LPQQGWLGQGGLRGSDAGATRGKKLKVIITAVSREFGAARSQIASDLPAKGHEVKLQEDFRHEPGTVTILGLVRHYIEGCDRVLALVGNQSGGFPSADEAAPHAERLPPGFDPLSYTQWEVAFAAASGQLSLFDGAGCKAEHPPVGDNDAAQQAVWRENLLRGQGQYGPAFANADALSRLVLRMDWPDATPHKPRNLPFPGLGDIFVGRDAFLAKLRQDLPPTPPMQ